MLVLSAQSRFQNFKVSQLFDIWLPDSSTLLRLPGISKCCRRYMFGVGSASMSRVLLNSAQLHAVLSG